MADSLYRANVLVCSGTSCTASGSQSVIGALRAEVARRGLEGEVRVVETGCRGFCAMGPVMIVYPEGIFYCQVQASDTAEIVEETLVKGRVVERLTYKEPITHQAVPFYRDIPFYGKQLRITLQRTAFQELIQIAVGLTGTRMPGNYLSGTIGNNNGSAGCLGDSLYPICQGKGLTIRP